MGLRTKIIASLLAILAVLALVTTQVLQRQLAREFAVQEQVQVETDMRRLLLALDYQMTEVDVILGSWSNFTGLYEYVAKPDAKFRQDELNADALRAAHFDWLMLANVQHQITDLVEVPRKDGSLPLHRMKGEAGNAALAKLGTLLQARPNGCGIFGLDNYLGFLCFRPLLTSDVKGPSRGSVIIGRHITPEMQKAIAKETGLPFELEVNLQEPVDVDAPVALSTLIGRGTVQVREHGEHLDGLFPIIGIAGRHLGEVRMHWERTSRQHMEEAQASVLKIVMLLIGATGLATLLIVDRLVVLRLRRIQQDLSRILAQEDWSGEVKASGRDEIAELARFANAMMAVIQKKMVQLRDMALRDTLTGLANRRKFDEHMRRALAQFQRDQAGGALILLDVDYFKRFNDLYGHPAGDQALIQVGRCLQTAARRPTDLAARLGGEEFALLLEHTEVGGARECAERARSLLLQAVITHSGNPSVGFVTLSAGIALFQTDDTPDSVYARADAALYAAKAAGRNRVVVG
ncbi:MAG: diguanylate cyclase [Rhodoferax sp.]|nr:diguanylate cyclase [Rhodoferax sp.]